ncbi:MAG TPA: hypothetical protein VK486_15855 [Thermoleophilaceae bacterium]|nr:hypothetical protein [Thermoleophilaceae bacterium]
MEALAGASTAYETGHYLAMAAMAVGLILLIRRAIDQNRPSRSRGTDVIAALVVAALLIVGVVRLGGDGDRNDPWKTGEGAQMKAGFVKGCESTSAGVIDCGCAFDHITSAPPYDTPPGLAALAGPVRAAQQSGNPANLPAVLVSAMNACRASRS